MARVHFGSVIVHELYYARDPFTSELFRVSLYQESFQCTVSELPTRLEALKETPELTVQLKLFGT